MITAEMVKTLRDKTGAGMMDCKKALAAADGDMDKAIENLRKSGAMKAEKKAGRSTTQGKIAVAIDGGKAAIVEILCETDFAAKTDRFMDFVKNAAGNALSVDRDGDVSAEVNELEKAELTDKIATIGENMQIRRACRWNSDGKFAAYLHDGGRVAVLVEVENETDEALLTDIAMHIAAFSPKYIVPTDIPAEIVDKEKEIAAASDPKLANKPKEMLDKILGGKIRKFYSEVCLMDQPWLRDDKTSLSKLKPALKVNRFVRWSVGEEL